MSTLILASSGNTLDQKFINNFLSKPLAVSKILYVTTASKKVNDTSYVERTRQKMNELRLDYQEFDIVGKSKDTLREVLASHDILYLEGGNTFYLLKAIHDTGFEKIVKEFIGKGLVYWGVSAGAYVACPSIVIATWSRRFDRCGVTDWSAMNLVPFFVKAHSTSDMLATLREKARDLSAPLRVLNDQQALVVKDGQVQLIGGGDEMIL